MAVLNIDLCANSENWMIEYNTQKFTSDLNGVIQTAELPGARWSVNMAFSNRRGRDVWRLQSTLAQLGGRSGRFYATPGDWERRSGNASGTGAVSAIASDGQKSISTDGWNGSIENLFYAGSYFEVNGELKMVTSDVSSDSSGEAEISFAPPLRKPATDGMQIRYIEPRAIMMLSDDKQASWDVSAPVLYAMTIDAIEALDL